MHVRSAADELQNYLIDASNMAGGNAAKVYLPETAEEIGEILAEANASRTPVTVSGARTGTVGGAIPFGGVVISLEKMNGLAIDRDAQAASTGAGVVLADLQKEAESVGLFYPPDPTEWSCQIGGTIATNASGARSFKYGATRNYVKALRVVLATGESLTLRRGECIARSDGSLHLTTDKGREIEFRVPTYTRPAVRKNVSGYFNAPDLDAIDLFIGSEGTLGVIAEATLELLPRPEGFFSGIVFFREEKDLLAFVEDVRSSADNAREENNISPTLLEYFDSRSLSLIKEKFPETPSGMAGAIFFEQETTPASEDALLEKWNERIDTHNAAQDEAWFTTTDQDREKMRAFRHSLPVAVNERVVRNGYRKIGTDMAVPPERFANFLKFYEATLSASGIEFVIFGHIGDAHLHANLLPKTDEEATRAKHIYGRCVAQAVMLGGTVSAEHGIGKLKRNYLAAMMGERYLNEMAAVKRALDPNGILGRGNMFDAELLAG